MGTDPRYTVTFPNPPLRFFSFTLATVDPFAGGRISAIGWSRSTGKVGAFGSDSPVRSDFRRPGFQFRSLTCSRSIVSRVWGSTQYIACNASGEASTIPRN